MRIRGIGLCVLLVGNAVSQEWADFFAPNPEKRIASWKADFQDPEKLKEPLRKYMRMTITDLDKNSLPVFIEKFDVQDKTIRSALQSLYHEASQKWAQPRDSNSNDSRDSFMCSRVIYWMGVFADETVKQFLLELVMDSITEPAPCDAAVGAYLRCADAQEMRDFFACLLADTERFSTTIKDAIMRHFYGIYKDADEEKREVFLSALYIVTAQEESREGFLNWDTRLRETSEVYAVSHQRLALLKKHSASEPIPDRKHTDRIGDLTIHYDPMPTAKELQGHMQGRMTAFTNISTNLAEFMARDFHKPTGKGGQ